MAAIYSVSVDRFVAQTNSFARKMNAKFSNLNFVMEGAEIKLFHGKRCVGVYNFMKEEWEVIVRAADEPLTLDSPS